ncbi:MAG: hypothetical protein E6K29_08050 [Gammaproteobacteria bacterium]|nr:MAG: hypothetical protein E6K29_08050 [Gammaproteobacteria bacterium]
MRAAGAVRDDSFGDVMWEINALAGVLRAQRLRVEEADALLGKVVATTDIALFAFDAGRRLKLVNPAGAQLLASDPAQLLGSTVTSLQLDFPADTGASHIAVRQFPGGGGRYEFRRRVFREGGLEHELISVSDLSRALRAEERSAWQRLIRVLGHEVNNSLTPIKSIAATLAELSRREPPPGDWREDLSSGLKLIGQRADALARFLLGYTALARLPPPAKRGTDLAALLERAAHLEQRLPVTVAPLPALRAVVDPDQIEQCVINLLRNAVDASLPTQGAVRLSLASAQDFAVIEIEDEGPGLAAADNVFVPFFTTKPEGCGIGLALARQIAEAHGGSLTLENLKRKSGCVAALRLPLETSVLTVAGSRAGG